MPGLLAAPIGQLGAGALVTLIVLMILTGKLVTRRQLQDTQADRDYWRGAHDTQQKVALQQGITLEKHTETLEKLLANDDAILHVVQEIQQAARGGVS